MFGFCGPCTLKQQAIGLSALRACKRQHNTRKKQSGRHGQSVIFLWNGFTKSDFRTGYSLCLICVAAITPCPTCSAKLVITPQAACPCPNHTAVPAPISSHIHQALLWPAPTLKYDNMGNASSNTRVERSVAQQNRCVWQTVTGIRINDTTEIKVVTGDTFWPFRRHGTCREQTVATGL